MPKDAFLSVPSEGISSRAMHLQYNFSRMETPACPVVSLAITYLRIKTPLTCYLSGIVPVACTTRARMQLIRTQVQPGSPHLYFLDQLISAVIEYKRR